MTDVNIPAPEDRCRLVLILGQRELDHLSADQLKKILSAGDVASIILHTTEEDENAFQKRAEPLVASAQALGAAVIVDSNSRIAGRIGADGMQFGQDPQALADAIDKFSPKFMVGAANVKTRHNALVIGEMQPDYLMFGKPGGDTRPEPHPKNIDLGNWWSSMVEIPCIVLGGSDLESVVTVAKSGAEFVAVNAAIFAPETDAIDSDDAAARVAQTNLLLDEHAPQFEIPEH